MLKLHTVKFLFMLVSCLLVMGAFVKFGFLNKAPSGNLLFLYTIPLSHNGYIFNLIPNPIKDI